MVVADVFVPAENAQVIRNFAFEWIAGVIKQAVVTVFGEGYSTQHVRVDGHKLLWSSENDSLRIEVSTSKKFVTNGKEQQLHMAIAKGLCSMDPMAPPGWIISGYTVDLICRIGGEEYSEVVQLPIAVKKSKTA